MPWFPPVTSATCGAPGVIRLAVLRLSVSDRSIGRGLTVRRPSMKDDRAVRLQGLQDVRGVRTRRLGVHVHGAELLDADDNPALSGYPLPAAGLGFSASFV